MALFYAFVIFNWAVTGWAVWSAIRRGRVMFVSARVWFERADRPILFRIALGVWIALFAFANYLAAVAIGAVLRGVPADGPLPKF